MSRLKTLLILICTFVLSSVLSTARTVSAEELRLKSGQKIKAPIITRTDEYVKVDMGLGIVVTYYIDEIENILSDSKSSAEFEEYQIFLTQQLQHIQRIQYLSQNHAPLTSTFSTPDRSAKNKVDSQIKDIESTVENLDSNFDFEMQKFKNSLHQIMINQFDRVKHFGQTLLHVLTLNVLIEKVFLSRITLVIISSWMLACYPLMLLARKRQEKHFWMAWIPVCHIYLLTKLTQKSLWWVIFLFMPILIIAAPFFVPVEFYKWWFFGGIFIGIINFLVVPALLWSKIAEELNLPAWLGILTTIPIVNVFTIHKFNQLFVSKSFSRKQFIQSIAPHLISAN